MFYYTTKHPVSRQFVTIDSVKQKPDEAFADIRGYCEEAGYKLPISHLQIREIKPVGSEPATAA